MISYDNNSTLSPTTESTRLAAVARRALMAADPMYFAWTPEKQEHFRATMDDNASTRVQQALLKGLFGIQCSVDQVDEAWSNIPESQIDFLNFASLLTTGIGDDYFYLNESFAEGKSLLDFSTLFDYNYDNHLFQEEAKREHFPHYKGIKYYAWQRSCWARLIIEGQFYYATLSSAASHIMVEVERTGSEFMRQLIPHDYIEGKDNGYSIGGGFQLDIQLDAGGQEPQLMELLDRWYQYQQDRWLELSEQFSMLPPAVYAYDIDYNEELHRNFIFNNSDALKKVRWRHFLQDCQPLMQGATYLTQCVQAESEHAASWLTEAHQDIVKNFDPTVVKLRAKPKFVVAAELFDDLN